MAHRRNKSRGGADDKPIPQSLKVVELLDIVPGHAGKPEVGEPIAIVTLSHAGDVETLMLSLPDVQRFAFDMLSVMAHHGDTFAQGILDQHFFPRGPQ